MTHFEHDAVLILRDNSQGLISLGCDRCETVTTHTCLFKVDTDETRASRYEFERDSTDRIWVLSCKQCGVVDLTPFVEDAYKSQDMHDSLHDFSEAILASSGGAGVMTSPWDFHEEFMDVLRGDDEMAELAREYRCMSWSGYLKR